MGERSGMSGRQRLAIRYVAAGMIGVAVLAYILALILGTLSQKAHIDFAAIVLVIVAAAGIAYCSARNGMPRSLKL